jgi:hypothetical protein
MRAAKAAAFIVLAAVSVIIISIVWAISALVASL